MRKPAPYIAALKIWLAGVLLGPVLLGLGLVVYEFYTTGKSSYDHDVYMLYILMVLYGGFFSLPSALALWLVISLQYRFRQSEKTFWPTIIAATFILTTSPFYFLLGDEIGLSAWAAAYLGGIWAGVLWTFYQRAQPYEVEPNEPLDANL